jgi:hypothetical protein
MVFETPNPWVLRECDHDWVQWSGATRCRKCGATQ